MIGIINADTFLKEHGATEPITSDQFYFGKSLNFHPQGLYSENIFGVEGSMERRASFSWIELNCKVIHPVIYDILRKRIFQKIDSLLSGEKTFKLDDNGFLVEDDDGDIDGMAALIDVIDKVRFSKHDDEEGNRNKIVDMIYYNIQMGTFFIDKLIVISPEFRPISVREETNEITIDELSKLYQKIIRSSNQIKGVSGSLFDILAFRIQLLIRDLYELVKVKVSKKSGMIRHLMLGKRVDFSARAVISPQPNLEIGQVGIPLRLAVGLFEPHLLHGLIHSIESGKIPKEFHKAVREFLAKEESLSDIF
jgi:hypothetical protein